VLKIFDTDDEARAWFKENDLEGVAFKQELGPLIAAGTADQHGSAIEDKRLLAWGVGGSAFSNGYLAFCSEYRRWAAPDRSLPFLEAAMVIIILIALWRWWRNRRRR
jgi:hypothetical protein